MQQQITKCYFFPNLPWKWPVLNLLKGHVLILPEKKIWKIGFKPKSMQFPRAQPCHTAQHSILPLAFCWLTTHAALLFCWNTTSASLVLLFSQSLYSNLLHITQFSVSYNLCSQGFGKEACRHVTDAWWSSEPVWRQNQHPHFAGTKTSQGGGCCWLVWLPHLLLPPGRKWIQTRPEGLSGPEWKLQLSLLKAFCSSPRVVPRWFRLEPILKPSAHPEDLLSTRVEPNASRRHMSTPKKICRMGRASPSLLSSSNPVPVPECPAVPISWEGFE